MQPELEFSTPKMIIKRNISKLFEHTSLMLKKNYLIMSRNMKITLFQLFSPFLVCCLIIFWQYLANIITDYGEINPEITPTHKISKCIPAGYSSDCLTIGYGIAVLELYIKQNNSKYIYIILFYRDHMRLGLIT